MKMKMISQGSPNLRIRVGLTWLSILETTHNVSIILHLDLRKQLRRSTTVSRLALQLGTTLRPHHFVISMTPQNA